MGQAGWDGWGVGSGGARGLARRQRLRIWTRRRCMRRVPPVGRAAVPAGAAVVRDDGLDARGAVPRPVWGVCASAAHGACVRASVRPARATAEGLWCCSVDHAYCHRS